ncbi:MAG: hypothetical protein AB8G86_11215 [Saprospiraceae bacterium]
MPTKENDLLNQLVIGQTYKLKYLQNGLEETGNFVAGQDPRLAISMMEKRGKSAQTKLDKWLK